MLPKGIETWSLTSLQQRLVKTGGRLVKHARCYWLLFGREPSDAAPDRKHAAADSGFAAAGRIGAAARRNQFGRRRGVEGGLSEKSKWGKSWSSGSGKGPAGRVRFFGSGRNAEMDLSSGNRRYTVVAGKGKWKFHFDPLVPSDVVGPFS